MFVVPVGNKAFKSADCNRFKFDSERAVLFALRFLRTDSAADGGEGGGVGNDSVSGFVIALFDLCNKVRNVNVYRAAADAGLIFAVKAAVCFLPRNLGGITEGNFLKILFPDYRFLRGHRMFFRFNSHFDSSLSVNVKKAAGFFAFLFLKAAVGSAS